MAAIKVELACEMEGLEYAAGRTHVSGGVATFAGTVLSRLGQKLDSPVTADRQAAWEALRLLGVVPLPAE